MRRLSTSLPILAALGLAIALPAVVPGRCFGFVWKHGTGVMTTYPVVPVTPVAPVYMMSAPTMVPVTTAVTSAAPSFVAPMVAMPAQYSVPAYSFTAPATAAPAFYPAAPAYYTVASPYLPATQAASPVASLPVAPFSFLSSFNPDAPMMPGLAGYDPAMPQARGGRILQGLRSALLGNKGMLFGSLLQLGINLFGQEFGFAPNAQDASILSGLVGKVLGEVLGVGPSNSSPSPSPSPSPGPIPSAGGGQAAPSQGAQTLVITITLPADSRIAVQQGGQQTGPSPGPSAGTPGTNPTGTSGGPGKP